MNRREFLKGAAVMGMGATARGCALRLRTKRVARRHGETYHRTVFANHWEDMGM